MSVNKCPWCGGKFGLVRHYHFRTGFPSVWLETGNASTRSNLVGFFPGR